MIGERAGPPSPARARTGGPASRSRFAAPGTLALRTVLALLPVAPAAAQPLEVGSACGGDAFSSAQVVEGRPPRRGPLTAVPDTLCADLAPQYPAASIPIEAYPVITPQVGGGGYGDPYGSGPRRHVRP